MAIVGEAYVVVKAITTGFNQQIQQQLNGMGGLGAQAGQQLGSSFSNAASSGMSSFDSGARATYDSINGLIEKSYYMQSALLGAAQAVGALAGGLFSLGSQAAAATPALIVLPSIFAAIAQAAIVAKLAFGGMGAAIGSLTKPKGGGAKAVDKLPDLMTAYGLAQDRATLAGKRLKRAQEAVTQAMIDAEENLQQLKFTAEGAALGEKKAALQLEKARKTLARVQDLPPNSTARKEAELAYQEAELAYRQAKDRNSDLKIETEKRVAAGVLGSKEYKDAIDSETAADMENKHAIDARAIAKKKLDEEKANPSSSGAANPMDKLTPIAQDFAKFIASLKPKLDELKTEIQKNLFPRLTDALKTLVNSGLFEILKTRLGETGRAIGDAAKDFATIFTSASNLKNLDIVLGTNNDTIKKVGKVAGNLVDIFLALFAAADPLIRRFTDWVTALTDGWKNADILKNKGGKLTDFFDRAGDVAAQLGRIIGNVAGALFGMGKAASGPGSGGQMIFDALENVTQKFEDFVKKISETGELQEFFRSTSENFMKIMGIFGKVIKYLLILGQGEGAKNFFESIGKAIDTLGGAFQRLAGDGASGAFGKFIEKMAEFIAATIESGSIKMYFGILIGALTGLMKILENPFIMKTMAILAAAHGLRTGLNRVGKTVGTFAEYIKGDFAAISGLPGKMKALPGALSGVGMNVMNTAMKMPLLGSAMTSLAAPLTAMGMGTVPALALAFVGIIAAIVAVIAIFVLAYKNSEILRDAISHLVTMVKDTLSAAFDRINQAIKDAIPQVDGIKGVFKLLGDFLGTYIIPLIEVLLVGAIGIIVDKIIGFIKIVGGIIGIFKAVWDFILGFFALLTGDTDKATAKFKSAFSGLVSSIGKIFEGVTQYIFAPFKMAFNLIAKLWNNTVGKLSFKLPDWIPGIGGNGFSMPKLPELAEGGVIKPTSGGTLARIGEAGRAERIEPLDKDGLSQRDRAIITMLSGGRDTGGINITVNPSPGMDEVELAALVSRQISFQLRRGAA